MWKVIGSSVTGTSHLAAGRECEDASAWRARDGHVFIAVADGAGSRPMSRHGAALAVREAIRLTAEAVGDRGADDPAALLTLVVGQVREQVTALASTEGQDPGDYASTLAVAVLAPESIAIAQVGDTIAVLGRAGHYETLTPEPHGEYVNETTFLTGPGPLAEARIAVRPAAGVDGVYLATDGLRFKILADLAVSTPFTPFFDDLTAYARSPAASDDALSRFLTGLDDQSGDDKTLVAAVRALATPVARPARQVP